MVRILPALLLLAACNQYQPVPDERNLREFNETHPIGRYHAVAKPDGSIWALDTQTGYIQRCEIAANINGRCAAPKIIR